MAGRAGDRHKAQAPARPDDTARAVEVARDGRLRDAVGMILRSPDLRALPPPERQGAAVLRLAQALLQAGWYEAAAAACAEVPAGRAAAPAALLKARALFCTDRLDEALAAARDATRLAPDDLDAALQVVATAFDMGLPAEAEAEIDSFARRAASGALEPAIARGLVLRRLERLDEAADLLAPLAPRHPFAGLLHAHSLHDLGRAGAALDAYRAVLRLDPGREEAQFGLVNTLADSGRLKEAALAYGRAAQAIPGFNQRWPEFLLPLDSLSAPPPAAAPPPGGLVAGGLVAAVAFVPFELPAVPLALGVLKAFVEHHSAHRVTTLDLNARFFQAVRDALAERATPFDLGDNAAFVAASDLLSAEGPDFFEAGRYEPAAQAFLHGAMTLKTLFERQGRQIRQRVGPISWHARAQARALLAGRPALVGLSAMYDGQLGMVHALARAVKSLDRSVRVVAGGSAVSGAGLGPLLSGPAIDYAVRHDGEETLLGLLDSLAAGGAVPDLPGLCRRVADHIPPAAVPSVPVRPDRVPPADFSGLDLGRYVGPRPVLPVLSSRGCYWRRCTFCNHFASYAGVYRAHPIARVVDEIEAHVERHGVRHFALIDEMISASRLRALAEEILARRLEVSYYALAKPTADFTPEGLDLMARSGCRYLLWGVESGNDRVLGLMDKGNTADSTRATLRAAARAGLRNHVFLIVGYPTETRDELADTVRLLCAESAAIDQTHSGAFVLEKGTPLHAEPGRFGIARVFDRRSEGACQLVRFEPASGLTSAQAAAAEAALRRALFRDVNPFSRLLGDFRDHAVIVYAAIPRPIDRPAAPEAARVMAEIDAALRGAAPSAA